MKVITWPPRLRFVLGIKQMPWEVLWLIFNNLDIDSLLVLVRTDKYLRKVFRDHREGIVLRYIQHNLSPHDLLLQHIVAEPCDLDVPWGPCFRRKIYHNDNLISEGEEAASAVGKDDPDPLPAVVLQKKHFRKLIEAARVIQKWEEHYPKYRFWKYMDYYRPLNSQESGADATRSVSLDVLCAVLSWQLASTNAAHAL